MTLSDLIHTGHTIEAMSVLVVVAMSIIQIAPIEINPWSWLGKTIGRVINREVLEGVKKIETDLDKTNRKIDENEAKLARVQILQFDDELYNEIKHSKEYFIQKLDSIDTYEEYCASHPEFKNSYTVEATKHIRATYEKCLAEHKFI